MPIATKSPGIPPVPAGVQHAIAIATIDIGTQPSFGNFPPRRKVKIVWELPNEKITVKAKDGLAEMEMPRVISKDYTLSTDTKANLRKELEAWRGRQFTSEEVARFEVATIIGANCYLNVVHKKSTDGSRTFANIAGIMPLPKGTPKLTPENKTMVYDLPAEGPISFPADMPEWIQNQIKQSEEYQASINPHKAPPEPQGGDLGANPDLDASVPF